MINFTKGNLLEAKADALVNTVNTVGVMGKGIAMMFKDAFPENFRLYEKACASGDVRVGKMFVTEKSDLMGPKWIINFPTKKHWRHPSKLEWITEGLEDLKKVVASNNINSVALPPLGSGNGGLEWAAVKREIIKVLSTLTDVEILVYEPTDNYQNVAKRAGVDKLTPARALVAELVRRYWVLGIECTLLEIQKLAYFLEKKIVEEGLPNPLDLQFDANRYGPFAMRLTHLLNALDGSYLHCEKRLSDAGPLDRIWFDDAKQDKVGVYLVTPEAKPYRAALDATEALIDGFQSPLGLELLATVDWILTRTKIAPTIAATRVALEAWPGGPDSAQRKMRLFDDRLIGLALARLNDGSNAETVTA